MQKSSYAFTCGVALIGCLLGIAAQAEAQNAPPPDPTQQMQEMTRHPPSMTGPVIQMTPTVLTLSYTSIAMPPGFSDTPVQPTTQQVNIYLTQHTTYVQQVQRDQQEFMDQLQTFNQSLQSAKGPTTTAAKAPQIFKEQPFDPSTITPGMNLRVEGTWQYDNFTASKVIKPQTAQMPQMPPMPGQH